MSTTHINIQLSSARHLMLMMVFGLLFALVPTALEANQASASGYDEELSRIGKEIASCLKTEQDLKIGAVDFTDLQGNANELGRLIAEELSTELVAFSRQNGFEVIDRSHLGTILREHKLSSSGLVSAESTKKLGEFAGLDILVTGNVLALENTIRVTVKALSTERASITCAARGDLPKTMAIDEMLAIGIGETAAPRKTSKPNPEEKVTPDSPAYQGQDMVVRLLSITKDRSGRKLHLSLEVISTRKKRLFLALDGDSEAIVIDNVGTEWHLARVGGIRQVPKGKSGDRWTVGRNASQFMPNTSHTVNLVFESEGSSGTVFSLAASFCAQTSQHISGFNIPFGISGMKTR